MRNIKYRPIMHYMENNHENLSDNELVKLTLNDQENFVNLMQRYEPKLLRYIKRITNVDNDEAEDILQDVFIKVYQNLNDFDLDLKFSSWIYRITHNQVISNYRKIKARPQQIVWDLESDLLNNIASDLDIEKETDIKILRKNINKILSKIDVKYREVLVLKYLEELDYNEISDVLKKPVGTVGTLLNRARKQFINELNKKDIKL